MLICFAMKEISNTLWCMNIKLTKLENGKIKSEMNGPAKVRVIQ